MPPAVDLPLDRIAELCREYGVIELEIFGSVARGESTENSDIDFLYVLSDPSIGMRFFQFQRRLAEVLGRDVEDVDLVPKNYLNRVIRDEVLAEARPVYAAA
jgi:predicted nucleotidyltransferase